MKAKRVFIIFLSFVILSPSYAVFAEEFVLPQEEIVSEEQMLSLPLEETPIKIEEPKIDPWKNLNGFQDLFVEDLFTGAASISIPLTIPRPSAEHLPIPNLSLNYNSYNKNRLSPYGYGWGLNMNSISRIAPHGVASMYDQNEFSFRLGGKSSELALANALENLYLPKLGNDLTQYFFSNNSWRAVDTNGVVYYFGSTVSERVENPNKPGAVFEWMLDRVVDRGNEMRFTYFQDHNQIYPSTISYAPESSGGFLYQIEFEYHDKSVSAVSYETQFPVENYKLLETVSVKVFENGAWNTKKNYHLSYNSFDSATPYLLKFQEEANDIFLPALEFSYYSSGADIHLLQSFKNNRGGSMNFFYAPSTSYKDGNGMKNRVPFIVQTLNKVQFLDSISGNSFEEKFFYSGAHYFIDYADVFGREYAGFHEVTKTEPSRITKIYFHQSQFSENGSASGEYDDHISKKGRAYREELYDASSRLLETAITKWKKVDLEFDRYFVFPERTSMLHYDGASSHEDSGVMYQYDEYANVIEEIQYGRVSADPGTGDFVDRENDLKKLITTYAYNLSNPTLIHFPATKKLFDQNNALVSSSEYYYDESYTLGAILAGDLTKQRNWNSESSEFIENFFSYDARGNLIQETDPNGNITTIQYDSVYPFFVASIKQEGVTDDRDLITSFSHDLSLGLVKEKTNPNGEKTVFTFDDFGRLKTKSRSSNDNTSTIIQIESYTYFDSENPVHIQQFIYPDIQSDLYLDGFGRVIEERKEHENGAVVVTDKKYDERGNISFVSLPYFDSGASFDQNDWVAVRPGTSTSYDAKNRPITIATSVGTSIYTYSSFKTTVTDPLQTKKDLYADPFGNLIQVTEYNEGQSYQTFYTYNALNLLTNIQDASGNFRTITYSSLSRRLTLEEAYNPSTPPSVIPTWRFSYDKNGNLLSKIDPNGNIISYEYDEFDRVKNEKNNGEVMYNYDYFISGVGKGLLSSVVGKNFSANFDYDYHGNVLKESKIIQGRTFETFFTFDILDQEKNITYPNGEIIDYFYNNVGFLEQITQNGTGGNKIIVSNFDYSPVGQISRIDYGNGVSTQNAFDINELYRLKRKLSQKDSVKLQDTNYVYDALGNILSITDDSHIATKGSTIYTYDDLSRLVSATANFNNSSYNYADTFSYDAIGNITYKSDIGSYVYAKGNSGNPYAATAVGSQNLSYDKNGNFLSIGDKTFTYDYRNLVSTAVSQGATTNFLYDHAKNRIFKQENNNAVWYANQFYELRKEGNREKTQSYIYAGNLRIAVLEGITQYDEDGDGWTPTQGDCNDSDQSTYPGAPEICGDSIDQDCSGSDLSCDDVDDDKDGYTENQGDCSDIDKDIFPGAKEICWDMADQDCDGKLNNGCFGQPNFPQTPRLPDFPKLPHCPASFPQCLTSVSTVKNTPLAMSATPPTVYTLFYYLPDHLSSTHLILNDQGSIVELLAYKPFGAGFIDEQFSSYSTPYTFTGKERDSETSLTYFGSRYYTDSIGRFTSQDPVILSLGSPELEQITNRSLQEFLSDPQLLNSYSYVRNNPIKMVDEEGEFVQLAAVVAMYAIRGAAIGAISDIGLQMSINAIQGKSPTDINWGSVGKSAGIGALTGGLGSVANMLGKGGEVINATRGVRTINQLLGNNKNQQYNWGDLGTLQKHFKDHGADFGVKNPSDYARKAKEFFEKSQKDGVETSYNPTKKSIKIYDPATNTLGSYRPDGSTRTFFKPDPAVHGKPTNIDYWNAEKMKGGEIWSP